jgi:predicted  nucleic acid-binding Zn-ribbon protein
MLTHVGETVSTAMSELAELNSEISDLHKQLAEVESQLAQAEEAEVAPELETADNEASE